MAYGDTYYRIGTWREYVKEIPWAVLPAFKLDAERTALIVVDMTRSQCDKDAPSGVAHRLECAGGKAADYYFETQSRVIPTIARLLAFFRAQQLQVIFLTLGPYLPEGRELPSNMRSMSTPRLADGSQRESSVEHHFEVIPELQPRPGDVVLHKLTASGFIGTNLDGMLRNLGIQNVVLTGAATHACVEATARTGADLGYKIILVDDACLDQSQLWHEMTMMNCLHFNWGKVMRSDELIAELSTNGC